MYAACDMCMCANENTVGAAGSSGRESHPQDQVGRYTSPLATGQTVRELSVLVCVHVVRLVRVGECAGSLVAVCPSTRFQGFIVDDQRAAVSRDVGTV